MSVQADKGHRRWRKTCGNSLRKVFERAQPRGGEAPAAARPKAARRAAVFPPPTEPVSCRPTRAGLVPAREGRRCGRRAQQGGGEAPAAASTRGALGGRTLHKPAYQMVGAAEQQGGGEAPAAANRKGRGAHKAARPTRSRWPHPREARGGSGAGIGAPQQNAATPCRRGGTGGAAAARRNAPNV